MPLPVKPIRNVDDLERLAESGIKQVEHAGQKTVEQATKQAEDTSRAFIDQLYAPSGGASPEDNQKEHPEHASDPSSEHTPEEQSQIEATRKQLEMLHGGNYNTQFGAEASLQRYRAKQREEEEKKRQEEEEAEQRKEEEAQRLQEVPLPSGKHTGMPNVPKPKISLEREKTKTEVNRGSTG